MLIFLNNFKFVDTYFKGPQHALAKIDVYFKDNMPGALN